MEAPLPGATTTTPFNPTQARSSITSLLLISLVLFLLSSDDPALQTQQGLPVAEAMGTETSNTC